MTPSPSTTFVFALGIVLVMSTCCHTVEGFAPVPRPLRFTTSPATSASTLSIHSQDGRSTTTAGKAPFKRTTLQMANDEESEESKAKRKNQQLGAAALLLFGILYDFFVTHNGVGFWDPNYVP